MRHITLEALPFAHMMYGSIKVRIQPKRDRTMMTDLFLPPEKEPTELKHEVQSLIVVDYGDFEKFVEKHLGRPYHFPLDMECNNDTDHVFNGIEGEELDDYDTICFEVWINTEIKKMKMGNTVIPRWSEGARYMARTLLEVLCNRGLIPSGDYLIRVSW